ncbi:prothoracicostatic peptide-like [Uloborus diversus]|uniref:prothoracicostatic peptide-like n=1 Tax=Uloborus diversus TaxID=327109 RepID=UPI002409DF37|nr:prothoracicostatic peptide-like [Uloborus diversus]
MQDLSLAAILLLSMVYITSCNPRISENPEKTEGNLSNADTEPVIPDQMDSTELRLSDDPPALPKYGFLPGKRGWNNLSNMWGKRGWNNLSNMWGKRENSDLPPYWDKRGWNNLSNVWGKRDWNKLSNVWGKRDWNKLSNVWGKRDWNKLSNMWGKRGWNNLSNVWGKRSDNRDDGKRTTQWNNLKSVWGKRDAEWEAPTMWESLPSTDDSYPAVYVPDQM